MTFIPNASLQSIDPKTITSPTRCHLITGGLPSLFHFTLLLTHSTASLTPVPVSALIGNTLESLILAPFSPSKTFLTNPSLILTTSTQSSLSCLFAKTNNGTPSVSLCVKTSSNTNLHSSNLPLLSCSKFPSPISVLSIMKT